MGWCFCGVCWGRGGRGRSLLICGVGDAGVLLSLLLLVALIVVCVAFGWSGHWWWCECVAGLDGRLAECSWSCPLDGLDRFVGRHGGTLALGGLEWVASDEEVVLPVSGNERRYGRCCSSLVCASGVRLVG